MDAKRTIGFGKIDWNGSGRKINELEIEMRLEDADGDKPVFAASLNVWNSRHTDCVAGGQMLDDKVVLKAVGGNPLYMKILGLWKRNHLNGMHAGTPEQEKCLADYESERDAVEKELGGNPSYYDVSCEILKHHGLYEVRLDGKPYKYGHAWLYRPISEEDLAAIKGFLGMEKAT